MLKIKITFNILKKNSFVFKIFIFQGLITIILSNNVFSSNLNYNIINLKIKGEGYKKIINPNYTPDKVYYNGNQYNYNGYVIIDNQKINNVTLVWENKLDSAESLFESIEDIIKVDLSQFDTSEVTLMNGMFKGCSNLQYINFTNINTSLVINMNSMFRDCISLLSLDLSNFDTSKVVEMSYMSSECSKITSIILSNFYTPN